MGKISSSIISYEEEIIFFYESNYYTETMIK